MNSSMLFFTFFLFFHFNCRSQQYKFDCILFLNASIHLSSRAIFTIIKAWFVFLLFFVFLFCLKLTLFFNNYCYNFLVTCFVASQYKLMQPPSLNKKQMPTTAKEFSTHLVNAMVFHTF